VPWTQADIDKLLAAGKIRGYKAIGKPTATKEKAPPSPIGLQSIISVLDTASIDYTTEFRFAPPRRFKFDIAIVEQKIAVEYEGLVATGKKGGHQTKAGYTSNCEKYNLAARLGWRLLRYTCRNYQDFEPDLLSILKRSD